MEPFSPLSEEDGRRLLELAERRTFDRGATIVAEGSRPGAIFVVRRGSVSVQRDFLGRQATVDEFFPGDVFGEMELLDPSLTSAAVVAAEPAEVDVLDAERLAELLAADPELAARFYRALATTLAERLRETSAEVAGTAYSWG